MKPTRSFLLFALGTAATTFAILAAFWVWSALRFGGLEDAFSYISGERLIVDVDTLSL